VRKLLGLTLGTLGALMAVLLGAVTALTAAEPNPAAATADGGATVADIPPGMLTLYQGAARSCPGLPWSVLAAIGKIETDHGRSQLPGVHTGENSAGAGGPMQFLAATWAAYGVDTDGDTPPDRYDPADAIYSAAAYLCANGAGQPGGLNNAVFAYNHAEWYVRQVLAQAAAYTDGASSARR